MIEVGQAWKTRDGRIARVVQWHPEDDDFPFSARVEGCAGHYTVTQGGFYFARTVAGPTESQEMHGLDLVELIADPNPEIAVGQTWRTRNGCTVTIVGHKLTFKPFPFFVSPNGTVGIYQVTGEGFVNDRIDGVREHDGMDLIEHVGQAGGQHPIAFTVGDTWRTRGGNLVVITNKTDKFIWGKMDATTEPHRWGLDGVWIEGEEHLRDLVELVAVDDVTICEAKSLIDTGESRKDFPIATGFIDYFPDAIAELARLAKAGQEQHQMEELGWDREKSTDHANCAGRHFIQRGTRDTDGQRHTAKFAWRALALLQLEIEEDLET